MSGEVNNKENVIDSGGGLTAEQKARISSKFRAAKALLARKRPLHDSSNISTISLHNLRVGKAQRTASSDRIDGDKRFPLTETPVNTPSPISEKGSNKMLGSLTSVKGSQVSELGRTKCETQFQTVETFKLSSNRSESVEAKISENSKSVHAESMIGLDPYKTPLRQPVFSGLSKSSFSSTVLDDDFDEHILEEIDALCEQNSKGKPEMKRFDSVPIENHYINNLDKEVNLNPAVSSDSSGHECVLISRGNQGSEAERSTSSEPDNSDLVSSDETFKHECILNSTGNQECEVEELKSSTATDTGRKLEATDIRNMPEDYIKYVESLNDRQQEAACSDISIPLIIVAGPGSGKTSTMVGRVLMLLHKGIGPSNILAMTFTTAAASEMRDRIGRVAGKTAAKELTISTFHSFSLQLCRMHAEKLGRTPEFLIYGHGQQRRAVIEAVRLLDDKKNGFRDELCQLNDMNSPQHFKERSKKWLKLVTQAKSAGKTAEYYYKIGNETGAAVLQSYNDILKSCNALDYHDLISCSVKLLTDFPEVFEECQELWKAMVIDEFQDTSAVQYGLLRILASHKRITIVGDEDQSIFGFSGADASGFDSFRRDFPLHKEVRLSKNYRSTRCIVEAASFLIQNNSKRCQSKRVLTDNSVGSKITIKECCNEDAQCSFVVDKILEITSDGTTDKSSFGDIAVLFRRCQEKSFKRHFVIEKSHSMFMVWPSIGRRWSGPSLLCLEQLCLVLMMVHFEEYSRPYCLQKKKKKRRSQLTQGRKVLLMIDMISKLVNREESISAVITSVANMIPQKYLLEQRAVHDNDGGKLLNEDHDVRPVLQYMLDDVSDFLKTHKNPIKGESECKTEGQGCANTLKAFIDHISERESENFHTRRHDNKDSVTVTTIHQSKGLEWDTVFIVKANESEIPLLHEFNGITNERSNSIEEERRLLYVAMTRARKKLFILYIIMDSNWQVLQPSRFLREIPRHLQESQEELTNHQKLQEETPQSGSAEKVESIDHRIMLDDPLNDPVDGMRKESIDTIELCNSKIFLKRFNAEDRAVVSHLFHKWAKKPAFQEPQRLLQKVGFVIDERLRVKKSTHKDVLRALKSSLTCEEALHYAETVLNWLRIPAEKRDYLMREKQEHFQKLRIESAMGSSAPTPKQIAYLQSLGCTTVPTSRLHASRLIEEYKAL